MDNVQQLSDKEIADFLKELDKDSNGCISYSEIEEKLDAISHELDPIPKQHHLHHEDNADDERHKFLRRLMASDKDCIPVDEFSEIVKSWEIPSLEQTKKTEEEEKSYMKKLKLGRKLRAYWEVDGPEYLFLALVVSMQLAFGIWQMVKYLTEMQYRHAFGWGVVLAKTSAGALYPTMFFLVLSMSRWFSTACRRFYYVSRFINWDLSQAFHIKISIVALVLATLHAIGHLTGSFLYGSRPAQQDSVAALLGPDAVPRPYIDYVRSLPGWSGLTAIGLFYSVALLSMPYVRKWSYEIFQLGHLLMFPMLGLLFAHGTAGLLQWPMLGYWLAFPTLLVLLERGSRIILGFHKVPASLEILDDDTVVITATIPHFRLWPYKAGQYVLLQVPQISVFQWHPFTISTCTGKEMQVHIKTDGDWTGKLQTLTDLKCIGIDGPFGAPAQRFYDFDQAMIVGAGIGVTPFSGILTDLQARADHQWTKDRRASRPASVTSASEKTLQEEPTGAGEDTVDLTKYRRVDFHWIVPDKNSLLWFSNLLNRISKGETEGSQEHHSPNIDIRIQTHVTKKRQNISTHIFRYLLEKYRTSTHAVSPLTGLVNPTHFGRPDLPLIMGRHYEDMLDLFGRDKRRKRTVGVFFCGAPVIGHQLADLCQELTLRGRHDRSLIEYHFMMEVFG